MEVLINVGWLVAGLVMLYFGAEWLVKGSANLALRVGISPLVVGLTVVAFGTSAPELVASIKANMETPPQGGLAVGNVVGSNICNIALVLGLSAVLRVIPVERQLLRRDMPLLLVVTALFLVFQSSGTIERWQGWLLVSLVVIYTVYSLIQSRKQGAGDADDVEGVSAEELAQLQADGVSAKGLLLDLGLIILGFVVLVIGADCLVEGGVFIAGHFGVPSAVIGLSVVAIGTSLPELATSVAAVRAGQGDIVVGNVVGSCLFNILAVVGVTAAISPIVPEGVEAVDLWVMSGVTVALLIAILPGKGVLRWQGGALLAIYLGYVGWLGINSL